MATYYSSQPNPQYTYKYQVSDEEEQTYTAHEESRDGPAVTGQYSYVDPLGSLIIVKYVADDEGYRETREVQENFLTIRARKPHPKAPKTTPRPAPPPRRVTPAPNNDSNLVASIIAQLTPFIKQTVTSSLGSRQTTTTRRVVPVQRPVVQAVPATRVTSTDTLFGEDGVNRIQHESPHFEFDHIIS